MKKRIYSIPLRDKNIFIKLQKIIGSEIKTKNGIGIVEKLYFTDLNILMVKIRYNKKWINYRIEALPELKQKVVDLLNNE